MSNVKIIQKTQSDKNIQFDTYIISLHNPEQLLNTLKEHSLNPILFKGILGKKCPQSIIDTHFSPFYRKFGPKSAIGCALSHLNVWKTFLKTNKKYAIIFEDDIITNNLEYNLLQQISFYISKTPDDFDILYLGSFGSDNTPNFFTIMMSILNICNKTQDINRFIKRPQVALGMHSYVISRTGAKKLVKYLDKNINNHIDYCIQNLYSQGKLNNYITKPRLLYQSSTDSNVSNNVHNTHPLLVNKILSEFYLDKHVKMSYITTLSVLQIGNIHITVSTLILLLFIIYSFIAKHNMKFIFLILILISLPDIYSYQ